MGPNRTKRNDLALVDDHTERLVALDGTGFPVGESAHIWEGACTLSEVDRLLSEIITLDEADLESDTRQLAS